MAQNNGDVPATRGAAGRRCWRSAAGEAGADAAVDGYHVDGAEVDLTRKLEVDL